MVNGGSLVIMVLMRRVADARNSRASAVKAESYLDAVSVKLRRQHGLHRLPPHELWVAFACVCVTNKCTCSWTCARPFNKSGKTGSPAKVINVEAVR